MKKSVCCILLLWALPLLAAAAVAPAVGEGDTLAVGARQAIESALEQAAQSVGSGQAHLRLIGNVAVERRNGLLYSVPDMPRLDRGVKEYVTEADYLIRYDARGNYAVQTEWAGGTMRHHDGDWERMAHYFQVSLFTPTLFARGQLSPLFPHTRQYYEYVLDTLPPTADAPRQRLRLTFSSRYRSANLFTGGELLFEPDSSGTYRVAELAFDGWTEEYTYTLRYLMQQMPGTGCVPRQMQMRVDYRFLWNRLSLDYRGHFSYGESEAVPRRDGPIAPDSVAFTPHEQQLVQRYLLRKQSPKSDTLPAAGSRLNNALADAADALVSSHSLRWDGNRSRVRLAPLLSPSYLAYSSNTGLSYKIKLDMSLHLGDRNRLNMKQQLGYNFGLKEFYWRCDNEFCYWPRRNAALQLSVGNGNRIYSSEVLDDIKNMSDSNRFDFEALHLKYFRSLSVRLGNRMNLTPHFAMTLALQYHRRIPVDYRDASPDGNRVVESSYNSVAPALRLEWTPRLNYLERGGRRVLQSYGVPVVKLDWEHGIKGVLGSLSDYSRAELDITYVKPVGVLDKLCLRGGAGSFFRHRNLYFVDYVFLSHSNLPVGWNDDMGATFQLLNSHWYNSANSYLRGHVTYESPFLLLHRMMKNRALIRAERLYASTLFISRLMPYAELGYGVETSFFDTGLFVSLQNRRLYSVGCKLTFSLFQD